MELREYQVRAKERIREAFRDGRRRIILCKPTGSGKTVTFADITHEAIKAGSRVIIAVDRKELLQQAKEKLLRYGINPSIITAGRHAKLGSEAYLATVQTLFKRPFPDIDLIIVDEAHKQTFDKLFDPEAKQNYLDKFVIGATATPIRTGKMKQLSDIYEEIIETTDIQNLLKKGYLVPAITYGVKMDTSSVRIKGGDYDEKELYKVFNKPKLYEGVVDHYKKFAEGTKAICFCINVEHSKKTAEAFSKAGIPALHVDGATAYSERGEIFRAFKNGFFKILCNVELATTGFDEWSIETVIVNRATRSTALWLQMCGRGARPTDPEFVGKPGHLQKSHFNLLDMGGNVFRLGFWEQKREFSLTHKKRDSKIQVAPVKSCPEDKTDEKGKRGCGALIHASKMICEFCGFKFEQKKTELAKGEFLPIEYKDSLPKELIGKAWGEMSVEDLERVRIARGYKIGWVVKQILLRNNITLEDYAIHRNFKDPVKWVNHMNEIYNA